MTDEQIIKLVLEIAGQEKADRLAKSLQGVDAAGKQAAVGVGKLDTATYELADAYEVLTTDLSEADRAMDRMVAEAVEATRTQRLLAGMLNETGAGADAAARGVIRLADAKDRAAKSSYALNSRVLEFGRAFQDVSQSGLAGGINNLERLVGGAGAAAGVITVLGTLVYVFKDQIAEAAKGLGLFADQMRDGAVPMVDRLKERIKELEGKSVKLTVDATELADAKRELAELEAGLAGFERRRKQTGGAEAKEAGKAIGEQIAEAQGGAAGVQQDLKASIVRDLVQSDPGYQAAKEGLRAALEALARLRNAPGDNAIALARQARTVEANKERVRSALAGVQGAAKAGADKLITDAESGSDAGREALARQLGKAGRGGLGEAVGATTVESFREDERVERELQESIEQIRAARKARAERLNREAEMLNIEGKRVEGLSDEQVKKGEKGEKEQKKEVDKARVDAAKDVAENSSLDEQAAAAAARARAAGGFVDRFGRFVKAGAMDQQAALFKDLTPKVAQARPDLTPEAARGVAGELAQQAFGQVDEVIAGNRQALAASGRGLNAAQINQQAIAATLEAVRLVGGKADQVEVRRNTRPSGTLIRRGR